MTSRRIQSPLRRRQGRTLIIVLVVLLLAGIGGYYGWQNFGGFGGAASSREILTAAAFRGPFDHVVLEQGEVESSSNIDVNCEVKSRSTGGGSGVPILWVIAEGSYVKKGDKLVELDASGLETEIKTQRIAVSSAEAMVISSEATVRTAEIALQEYLEGTYMSERKTLLSEVALAQQELRKAELNLASAERLAAKGVIKGLQIEAEEFAVINAKNMLEAAEAKLKVLDELTKEKNKVQFESDIEAAKAKLDSDRSVLVEEQEKLKEIEDQIAKCIILSPADGVVVYNNKFSSRGGAEFVVEEGSTVRERQTIIKLPDPTKMQVKANVNESRINLIGEGMAAQVKVSAVPQPMLAKVVKVNKYAEPGSWFSSSVKEYATFIEITNPPPAIRTGMTAEVRIFVEQLDNALQIPVHGIYEYRGHHFCLVQDGENWKTVEIEIGATNDKMVTITSGLDEGDEVALNPRQHMDLLELPNIEDVVDRSAIKKMGADAKEPEAVVTEGKQAGPPGGGPPGGGAPGAGGMDPSQIVDAMFSRSDQNGDGKISGDEVNERMKDRLPEWDKNGDGAIDKAEALEGMKNFSGGGQ